MGVKPITLKLFPPWSDFLNDLTSGIMTEIESSVGSPWFFKILFVVVANISHSFGDAYL